MLQNSFFYIIKEELKGEGLAVSIRLNPNHAIYKAHFPGRPITPGVCQIQIVTEVLSSFLGKEVYLTDIRNVKYMSVISPEEVTELTVGFLKITDNDDVCKVTVVFQRDEQLFSKMSMTYHVVRDNSNI